MKKNSIIILLLGVIMFTLGCATSGYYKLGKKEFTELDYILPVKHTQVRNLDVGYIDQGSGDMTLILIHGLGSNAKGWIKNIPVWAEEYRVIALDLPGYGISAKGHYDFSMSFYARVITELMDELEIESAVLIGHSMGAQIAMVASLKYPDRVSDLVLISPAGFEQFDDGEAHWMKNVMTPELVKNTGVRNIDINLKANFYNYPEDAAFMVTDRIQIRGASDFELYCYAVSRNVTGMLEEPVWDKLDKITQPTLILFGENDGLIPNPYLHGGNTRDVARIGDEAIPNSKLVMMPECGHFVQFEKWEETNEAVKDFLR